MIVDKIEHYLTVGAKDKNWYAECQAIFELHFGRAALPLVANLFAATSINSSLASNIRLFRKAYHELTNGLPFSNYLPVMRLQLDRIRAGQPIQGRKIGSFAKAMQGDPNAVVVDIWLLRAFDMDKKFKRSLSGRQQSSGASDVQYTQIEGFCRYYAKANNYEARQISAMLWAGCRIVWTGNKETSYKNILQHQLYNMYDDNRQTQTSPQ
jgi:hypothetical protein